MPSRDILLETNRQVHSALQVQPCVQRKVVTSSPALVLLSLANDAVTIPKQPWPFSAA
jgi:hypothetical protein